jgi:hypothetical protein
MRIITLEDHFSTSLFRDAAPHNPAMAVAVMQRGTQVGVERRAELLDPPNLRLAPPGQPGVGFAPTLCPAESRSDY